MTRTQKTPSKKKKSKATKSAKKSTKKDSSTKKNDHNVLSKYTAKKRSACKYDIGGQAVIEGVMMRSKYNMAVAVRRPDNTISIRKSKVNSLQQRIAVLRWPFIRGVVSLFETLISGVDALTYSANESIGEEEEKLSTKELAITMTVAFSFAIGLFVVLPFFISKLISEDAVWFNVIDGVLRILFFLAYILVISRMEDIKRIFEYHGAEHKSVHVYEHQQSLTVKNARPFTRIHPRCGTSFILIVLVISVIIFSFITTTDWVLKFFLRLALLPVIAGTSFEILKLSAKYQENIILKVFTAPGRWFQHVTTAEPDDTQLEVALAALDAVLEMEEEQ